MLARSQHEPVPGLEGLTEGLLVRVGRRTARVALHVHRDSLGSCLTTGANPLALDVGGEQLVVAESAVAVQQLRSAGKEEERAEREREAKRDRQRGGDESYQAIPSHWLHSRTGENGLSFSRHTSHVARCSMFSRSC